MEWLQKAKSILQSSGGRIVAPCGLLRCAMFDVPPRLATVHIFDMNSILFVCGWLRVSMDDLIAGRRSSRLSKRSTCLCPRKNVTHQCTQRLLETYARTLPIR